MSGVHFLISVTGNGCLLRDLSSRNGTRVNGQRINRQRLLHDGDLILAGKTVFSVDVDDQIPEWMSPASDESGPLAACDTAVSEIAPQFEVPPLQSYCLDELPKMPYTRDRLQSGVSVFRPLSGNDSAAYLTRLLFKKHACYFVVNMSAFARSSMTPFHARVEMLDRDVGIVAVHDLNEMDETIHASWGKDSTIFLQSSADSKAVTSQVLSAISTFRHPSVLRKQMLSAPNRNVSQLLSRFEAIVIERMDGASWELYSTNARDWNAIGFSTPPMHRGDSASPSD